MIDWDTPVEYTDSLNARLSPHQLAVLTTYCLARVKRLLNTHPDHFELTPPLRIGLVSKTLTGYRVQTVAYDAIPFWKSAISVTNICVIAEAITDVKDYQAMIDLTSLEFASEELLIAGHKKMRGKS